MISIQEAKNKIKLINADTPDNVVRVLSDVLDRKRILKQQETFSDPDAEDYMTWLEQRLSQPHLGYLDPTQANGIWGGSTTEAFAALAKNYHIAYDIKNPILGSDTLRALLDGSRPKEKTVVPSKHSYDWFKELYGKKGYVFRTKPGDINVLGVRGYLLPTGEVPNVGDKWNDTIFVIFIDKAGNKVVRPFVATVDPGLYYYHIKPMNPEGCAHLVEGQYKHKKGLHGSSQYPAFVQAGPVTVARTNSASFNDRTKRQTGWFGIHIHAGYEYGNDSVYNSSAGCQVLKSPGRAGSWPIFYNLVASDKNPFFYYTLMNSGDLK